MLDVTCTKRKLLLGVLLPTAMLISDAHAGSYYGEFTSDNDVATIKLDFAADGWYRIVSRGYSGGLMSDGTVVDRGGFDTMFTLADGSGKIIIENDDVAFASDSDLNFATEADVNADPVTGQKFDAVIVAELVAGSYTLAVTQYDNQSLGGVTGMLSEGFFRDGSDNSAFTVDDLFGSEEACPLGTTMFCSVGRSARTGDWAVDVSPVPLPAALPLFATALLGLGWAGRRARKTA
jgi:hypothetical protein